MSNAPISNPRRLAVACLLEVEKHGLLVPEAITRLSFDMSDEQLAYAHEIIYGTFRYLPGLEKVLAHFCKPRKLPPPIRWLLLSFIYQIHFMRAPDYAVVDEANKLAIKLKFKGLKPLVNGVLRNVIRKGEEVTSSLNAGDWLLPEWLMALFSKQYDSEMVDTWLEAWRERGQTSYWSAADEVEGEDPRSQQLPHAFRGNRQIPLKEIKARKLYIQNESSQAVSELVCQLKPSSILDLCAAPGGKTCYLARFANANRILACDCSAERVARMNQNRDRLGLSFETRVGDGRHLELDETFDVVLLDAPCTGIGIIGRHPEIKFLKKQAADDDLKQLQRDLLNAAYKQVKPGGYLLYTVCSLDANEIPQDPEGSQIADDANDFLETLPCHLTDGHFHFSPGPLFDGFSGTLLKKPV